MEKIIKINKLFVVLTVYFNQPVGRLEKGILLVTAVGVAASIAMMILKHI